MAYIAQDRTKVDQLIDDNWYNQFIDNLEFLAQPPIQYYRRASGTGDYSTTAQQFMVAIDSTNMKFTINHNGGTLITVLTGLFRNTDADGPAFGLSINDNNVNRNGEYGYVAPILATASSAGNEIYMTLLMPVHGLVAGTYTIEPVWAANPDGNPTETVYLLDDLSIFWAVWEV